MVILIGGTSNVGKSTISEFLGDDLGFDLLSTDSLAKHPGRPWRTIPKEVPLHVRKHYLNLSTKELVDSVLTHYDSLWTRISEIIKSHLSNGQNLIIEGSAILPSTWDLQSKGKVFAFWLTSADKFLLERIRCTSNYFKKEDEDKLLIDKFYDRTILFKRTVLGEVSNSNMRVIDVDNLKAIDDIVDEIKNSLSPY